MIKKIIIVVILIMGLNFVYKNVLDPYLSTFKDKKFDTYYPLNENNVVSENYKIRKLNIKMIQIDYIEYEPISSNYIISARGIGEARSLWKVNKFGVLIDSLFAESKDRKFINLPKKEGVDSTGFIVPIDQKEKKYNLVIHKMKTVGVYSSKYGEGPAYLHYNEKPPIELQHFTKKKRSRKPLSGWGANGSNGRYGNGWHGTGYFEWNYKSNKIHFKTDVFDTFGSYRFDVEISTLEEQKKSGLAFLYLRKNSTASALYVVTPKNSTKQK